MLYRPASAGLEVPSLREKVRRGKSNQALSSAARTEAVGRTPPWVGLTGLPAIEDPPVIAEIPHPYRLVRPGTAPIARAVFRPTQMA